MSQRARSCIYVNQGPDRRAGGWLGHVLAWLQRTLSFHSSTPPYSWIYRRDGWKVGLEFSRPGLLPFFLFFKPHAQVTDRQRWYSFRAGWRWDQNWPGYISDCIVKLKIDNLVE